jgi:hypothetical protein
MNKYMKKPEAIWEYEELLKAKRFLNESQDQYFENTIEKIKKGLGTEYINNINDKIRRWIDITNYEHFIKAKSVDNYILIKMLYRDGFYQSAIITARGICEMICYEILNKIEHPFNAGDGIELINFRTLIRFIAIPKEISKDDFDNNSQKYSSIDEKRKLLKSYTLDPKLKTYNLKIEEVANPKNLKDIFLLLVKINLNSFEVIGKENFELLNNIYDKCNTYVHASNFASNNKEDARDIILKIGKILYDIYGIKSINDLQNLLIESAYINYPDICNGIKFWIESFSDPEEAINGYYNLPSKQFINKVNRLNGFWDGRWSCNGSIIKNVTLYFFKEKNENTATLNYKFKYCNLDIKVSEKLRFRYFKNFLQLNGYDVSLDPQFAEQEYSKDYFELEFLDNDLLIGSHHCYAGSGKAIFYQRK